MMAGSDDFVSIISWTRADKQAARSTWARRHKSKGPGAKFFGGTTKPLSRDKARHVAKRDFKTEEQGPVHRDLPAGRSDRVGCCTGPPACLRRALRGRIFVRHMTLSAPGGPVPPPLPAGFRFASGSARSSGAPLALESLLRERLRLIAMVFFAMNSMFALFNGIRLATGSVTEGADPLLRGVVVFSLTGVVQAWVIWMLRPSAKPALAFLRRVELVVVGIAILAFRATHWIDFPTILTALPTLPVDLGVGYAMLDAVGIVAYGLLIPNTWRRCAAIVAAFVLSSVFLDFANIARFAVPVATWVPFVVTKLLATLTISLLSVFGAYRIEQSEGLAREASQLGQYVLRDKLGAGGMGEVYLAEHRYLRRPCAVKIIHAEQAGHAQVLQRFEREVQATAALTHPNTVAIYDYGISDDGTFYYVMEYLPGDTLEQLVERDGPLTGARAVHVVQQLVGALHEAHAAGLTHRDLKPGNVMVCERGGVPDVAKLLDFGLVASHGGAGDDDRLTQVGMLLGSPAYMSPEQCNGEDVVGPASDIYSLGALLCFALTGQPPFERRAPVQTMMAHLGEVPVPPSTRRAGVDPALDAIVMRCLAKRPRIASRR